MSVKMHGGKGGVGNGGWEMEVGLYNSRLILHTANERRRYKVTQSLIGWEQT